MTVVGSAHPGSVILAIRRYVGRRGLDGLNNLSNRGKLTAGIGVDAHRASRQLFTDCIEQTMAAVVVCGALLLAAGLLRFGAPASGPQAIGVEVLYGLAGFSAAGCLGLMIRGIFSLKR